MKNTYFGKIVAELKKEVNPALNQPKICFSTLKILEYWMRILNTNPECLNKEVAIRLMSEPYIVMYAHEVEETFKDLAAKGREDTDNFCRNSFINSVRRYRREKNAENHETAIATFVKETADADRNDMHPSYYQKLMKITLKLFREYAMEMLSTGIDENDVSFVRMQNVKKTFRLSDDEMELLLYLWLRESPDLNLSDDSGSEIFRPRRYRDLNTNANSLQNISRALGMSVDKITSLLGKDSSLVRLQLVDCDLEIPRDVQMYLSCYSDDVDLKPFKLAAEPTVSFAQLQGKNPDAKLALDMLKYHDFKHPLHILFYGVEGTGKTELAKAIAKEARLPLLEVSIDTDEKELFGRRAESRSASLMQYRIRGIALADWQCEQSKAIILVDEADMVLNCAEKGTLNSLFESTKAPVIWISNSMNFVENSTRRRFDFSMAFKRLAKDERVSVLNSVLKAQKAEKLLTDEDKVKLMVEYPAMAGGLTLAVKRTVDLMKHKAVDSPYKSMARMLKAHTALLGIPNGTLKDVESHAPNYSLEGLNIEGSTGEIMEVAKNYDEVWKTLNEDSAPNSLNMLLYGPPGTGKTEFVRHLARSLGRNLIIKRASDLLGMYVGQTEAMIAEAFAEADRTQSILFFDEADSFLGSREFAHQGHEISKTNELLTQMENFRGIFIAATNFEDRLDAACRRRFALKLGFSYLKPEGIGHIWNAFFPDVECPASTKELPLLTPGDFNAVNGRLRYLPATQRTPERIEAELRKEIAAKDQRAGRSMGF